MGHLVHVNMWQRQYETPMTGITMLRRARQAKFAAEATWLRAGAWTSQYLCGARIGFGLHLGLGLGLGSTDLAASLRPA